MQELIDDNYSPTEMYSSLENIIYDSANKGKINLLKTKNNILQNKNAPWFDKDCRLAKKLVNEAGKNLRKDPSNVTIRIRLFCLKKQLNALIKKKKTEYKNGIMDNMKNCKDVNRKRYWKLFDKLTGGSIILKRF